MTNPESSPAIDVRGVTKIFRDFWGRPKARAVDGIDFQVPQGEVFGLLGPNGSGKSTTLKMLLGLLHPTAGDIRVLGRAPHHVAIKTRLGYMPEEACLYPYLTAHETLDLYGRLFGLPAATRRERSAQLLEMTGLAHMKRRVVGEFSKGMARRLSLAQALLNDPELILLDEPTSGLDPIGCRQFKDLMLHLAARGKTIVLCTHLLADVEDVCNRIAILYNGHILLQGRMDALLSKTQVCRITLADPPAPTLQELLAWLRAHVPGEPAVDHPQRRLEELFIATIEGAQAPGDEVSGARPHAGLAPFLNRNQEPS